MKLIKRIMQWPLWVRYAAAGLVVIGGMYLLVFITITQYFERGIVKIDNLSGIAVDSIQVRINNLGHTIGPIIAGQSVQWRFKKRYIHSKHDVWYTLKGYRNNELVLDQNFFSNDLGYIPDSFRMRILKGFKIEQF